MSEVKIDRYEHNDFGELIPCSDGDIVRHEDHLGGGGELRRELATCKQSLQVATDETADLRRQLEEANSLLRNLTDERSAILSYLRESGFTPCGEVGPLQCLKAFINKSREDTARLDKFQWKESKGVAGKP